jgi:hypothetical protein
MIVVVPSARQANLAYLEPLIASGARFIVVDDTEGSITIDHPQFEVYTWKDRRHRLGELEVAIPKRNGACRDFGFYIAWMEADDEEVIIALDDDCQVLDADFAGSVLRALAWRNLPIVTGPGRHWNVLDLYQDLEPPHPFPRGFPYSDRLGYAKWKANTELACQPVVNLGLWQGVFDVNAVDKLALSRWSYPGASLSPESVVVPRGVLVSACSMNMHFRRAVIPAIYQLPMPVELAPGCVIDRYADIWGGFILKTLMDVRGDWMSVGAPMIYHSKEGSFTRNLHQENLCHIANDEFLAVLGNAAERLRPAGYLDMMQELREIFAEERGRATPIVRQYLEHLHVCLGAWVKALRPGVRACLPKRQSAVMLEEAASA